MQLDRRLVSISGREALGDGAEMIPVLSGVGVWIAAGHGYALRPEFVGAAHQQALRRDSHGDHTSPVVSDR